jgi:hypothetical protein
MCYMRAVHMSSPTRVLGIICVATGAVVACASDNTISGSPPDAEVADSAVNPGPDTSIPLKDSSVVDSPVDGHGDDHFNWPDCTTQPNGVPTKAITDVWNDNPTSPTQVWLSGVYVTGITKSACTAGVACDIFVQQDLSYGSLQQGAHHAIKMFISAATAMYFTGTAVGDKVDAMGWAYRYTTGGNNELLLQVDQLMPGCAHKTGSGNATPVGATIDDLSLTAAETTLGPLFVQVTEVRGTPKAPTQTFGIGSIYYDGSPSPFVSLSPYFLPNGAFVGLVQGQKTTFKSVAGVFAITVPSGVDAATTKYLEIHPRSMTEVQ